MIPTLKTAPREIKHPNTILRKVVFQHLYQAEARRVFFAQENEFEEQCGREGLDAKLTTRGVKLVATVFDKLDVVDEMISSHLVGWKLERISKVDKAILRMGAAEILYTDISPNTVMDECIEIAKSYSEADSSSFINAVLDRIAMAKTIET
jgi:N utilization substance protein B